MRETPPKAAPPSADSAGPKGRVLVVDDEKPFRSAVCRTLRTAGYEPVEAADGQQALDALDAQPVGLVLLDLKLDFSARSGMEVLRTAVERHPHVPVVMISGESTIRAAVEATQIGAYDFLEKGVSRERLLLTVRNALEKARLEHERDRLLDEAGAVHRMIGSSGAMQTVTELVDRAARTDIRVLITGESGVGKEVVARNIHHRSRRAGAPFVAVNCAAIPSELIESELFGHEKGAFNDAVQRIGKFEEAHGGTLFLDEVGDMSLKVQTKVLRALQEGEITRVGGEGVIGVDVRVIAATNKHLPEEIRAGRFRDDLYFRLVVLPIHVPPLRERQEDVPALAEHFLRLTLGRQGLPQRRFAPEAHAALAGYGWPGNVRELENVVELLIALCDGPAITAQDVALAFETRRHTPAPRGASAGGGSAPLPAATLPLAQALADFERGVLVQALVAHGWSRQETAAALGIDRTQLWRKMKHHRIEAPGQPGDEEAGA